MCIRDRCRKDALCKASRFEKRKAQEDGIAHASPVSYTHLTAGGAVVERHLLPVPAFGVFGVLVVGFAACAAISVRDIQPTSTLDVYKRQVSAVSNLSWSYEEDGIFFHHVLSRSYKGLGLSQQAKCPRSLWEARAFLANGYSFAVLAM